MDEQKKHWTEWIRDLPNWVKGTIGLATLIITFAVLFRDNPYLSITVSVTLILVSVFCFSLYLVLNKKDVGGKACLPFREVSSSCGSCRRHSHPYIGLCTYFAKSRSFFC